MTIDLALSIRRKNSESGQRIGPTIFLFLVKRIPMLRKKVNLRGEHGIAKKDGPFASGRFSLSGILRMVLHELGPGRLCKASASLKASKKI